MLKTNSQQGDVPISRIWISATAKKDIKSIHEKLSRLPLSTATQNYMDVVLVLHREGKGEKEEARMHFYLDRILVEYANSHGNLEKIRFMIRLLSVLGYIGDSYSIEPDALFAKVTEVLVAAQEASSYASSKLSPMTDEMCARIDALSRVNVALSHFFLSVENKNAALLSDKLILTELISTISGKMSESKIEAQRISDMCDKIGVEKELKSKVIFMYGKGASRE